MRDCSLTLRTATKADARILHAWRNDPDTRHASRSDKAVLWPEHEAWLVKSLLSQDRIICVAEEKGQPVGVVRADRAHLGWELSWSVAREARGRGIGKKMLQKFVAGLDGRLIAIVRRGNVASEKLAAFVGLKHVGKAENPEFDLWILTK